MNVWMHTTIAATALVATVAVAVAGVSLIDPVAPTAAKEDRLPVTEMAAETEYTTIEMRGDGVSVLQRVPVTTVAAN